MHEWFYHEPGQGRLGPFAAEEMRRRYRERRLQRDTLVWRDGLREWQPLERVFDELDLFGVEQDARLPPPLPATMPASLGLGAAPAMGASRGVGAAPAATRPAARSGLSGCAIAAIVLAIGGVVMTGILAAIALPAYQEYTVRAKVLGALAPAFALQPAIAEHALREGRCPVNGDDGFGTPDSYATPHVTGIRIGTLAETDRCALAVQLRGIDPKVDGQTVVFEAVADGDQWRWACSGSLPARFLPTDCRDVPTE